MTENQTTENLSPERAVRLLRAKAGELEAQALNEVEHYGPPMRPVTQLAADVGLLAGLLAAHIEDMEKRAEQMVSVLEKTKKLLDMADARLTALETGTERGLP